MSKPHILKLKRGDDFKLDLTIQDLNNVTAVAAGVTLTTAKATYATALAADPASQATTDALAAQGNAQTAYDNAIIVDISGWTITAAMAWGGVTAITFTVTLTDAANGILTIVATAAETALVLPRTYNADVQFVRSEGKVSSETFQIQVLKDITSG